MQKMERQLEVGAVLGLIDEKDNKSIQKKIKKLYLMKRKIM